MMGYTAGHQSGEIEKAQEGVGDSTVRAVSQWAIDHAPCITFAAARALAVKRGMTVRDLAMQFQADVERPREVFTRAWDRRLGAVVMPYRALIAWYEQATTLMLAEAGEPTCACGCGVRVRGRRTWASPGCRQRAYRRARTVRKLAAVA